MCYNKGVEGSNDYPQYYNKGIPERGEAMTRKTKTSSEVKKRYNDKTYKQYAIKLRYDTDAELIKRIEDLKAKGLGTTAAIKKLAEK